MIKLAKIIKINFFHKFNAIKLLWTCLTINFVFLIIYEIYIKSFLLNHFTHIQDIINKNYYSQIFSYLKYPLVITSVIIFFIIIYYPKINRYFDQIRTDRSFLISIILLNIIIQTIILFTVQTIPFSDSKYYIEAGQRLFLTGSYVSPNGNLTSFWPVGLPAYLAFLEYLTPHYILVAKLINIIISSSFIVVIYLLFKNELSKKGLFLLLLGFTLFPNNLFSANTIMTDYPFSFLLWVAILLSLSLKHSYWRIILISIILGVISYLRPLGLLLPLIFAVYLVNKYGLMSSLKKIILMFVVFLLMLAPWIYRNYNLNHTFVPISTNGGFNFLMGNHVNSSGCVNFDFSYQDSLSEVKASQEAYFKGMDDIISHPVKSILRLPTKIFFSYYRGDSSITWALKETENKISTIILSSVFFITNYFFYLILFLSTLCILCKKRLFENAGLKYFMFSIYIYFILIILIYVGAERYLIPLYPVHFYLAGRYIS